MIDRLFDLVSQLIDKIDSNAERQEKRIQNRHMRKQLRQERKASKRARRENTNVNTLLNISTTVEPKTDNMTNRIEGTIRHLLSMIGPWLVYKGYFDAEQITEITNILMAGAGVVMTAFAFIHSWVSKQTEEVAAMGIGFPFFRRRNRVKTYNIKQTDAALHYKWLIEQKAIQDKLFADDPNNYGWGAGQIYGAIKSMRSLFPSGLDHHRYVKDIVSSDIKDLDFDEELS